MVDSITTDASGLVDRLGTLGRLETRLRPRIVDGALHLDSVAVVLRLAGLRLALWPVLAPRVSLVERFDDETDRQQVRVTVSAPVLGRLYEYAGSFRYSVQQGESAE